MITIGCASIIAEGLNEAGHLNVRVIHEMRGVARLIETLDLDVIIIDIENPNRDMMEQLFQLSRTFSRPIAMLVDRSDTAWPIGGSRRSHGQVRRGRTGLDRCWPGVLGER